jgi:hypothetical protein
MLQRFLEQREKSYFLFPSPATLGTAVRAALRRADPRMELRSIRRGSLLDMAERGVPEVVMLEFSGHTTLAMLRRYLAWGTAAKAITNQTAAAGARLTVRTATAGALPTTTSNTPQ